jgi:uncharacterized membrane protein YesL
MIPVSGIDKGVVYYYWAVIGLEISEMKLLKLSFDLRVVSPRQHVEGYGLSFKTNILLRVPILLLLLISISLISIWIIFDVILHSKLQTSSL